MSNSASSIQLLNLSNFFFFLMQIRAEEFFNLFFSDDSVNFHESFHRKCGDKGIGTLAYYVFVVSSYKYGSFCMFFNHSI